MRDVPRLHMGPVEGRDPGIRDLIAGYAANPPVQAEASRIPLFTAARLLREGRGYDTSRAVEEALGS